jgi:sigma-B regulation protein RsbU (phosphoserine phosphatase)
VSTEGTSQTATQAPDERRWSTTGLACGEVRGGNEPVYTSVDLPGLRGILYSRPCHGPEGGDVHYLSVCGSGLVTRLCVADVAGHGQVVAAVGREMHAHLRKSVNKFDDRRVMAELDRRLETEGLRAITTAALASYYHPSQRLTVAYAGHPPGWLYRASEDRWQRLEASAPAARGVAMDLPLGTGLGPDFSRQRLKAPPGDRVLLVTDGVLEAPAPDGAEFGAAGVEAALVGGPEAIAERLLTALRAHTGGDELIHDDVTFFVGEFVDGPPGPTLWKVLKNRVLPNFI